MRGEENSMVRATGSCLCGRVRYVVRGPLAGITACHCYLCRRLHGHFSAYTACDPADLEISRSDGLRWYRTSPVARHGFCARCGAQVFSERSDRRSVAVAAGTLDEPTGLHLSRHAGVRQKGDYYEITDGLPQIGGAGGPMECGS